MKDKNNFVIALTGPSGSGKTYFAKKIKELFPDDLLVMGFDNYCKDFSKITNDFASLNYDEPASYEGDYLAKDIEQLKQNHPIYMPLYDFVTHSRKEETQLVNPKKIILIEGLFPLNYPTLAKQIDYVIYLDAKKETRFSRRLYRDQLERGRSAESIKKQWDKFVHPMELIHVLPNKMHANLIIDNNVNNFEYRDLNKIVSLIKDHLSE